MANLAKGVKPVVLIRYPHMLPEDVKVWSTFLASGFGEIREVWYDVHVGTAVRAPEILGEAMQRVADAVTRKRIDVVGRVGAGFWVIEVKPVCGSEALGQAVMYRRLFSEEFGRGADVIGVVVCNLVEVDVVGIADDLGVLVIANEGILR